MSASRRTTKNYFLRDGGFPGELENDRNIIQFRINYKNNQPIDGRMIQYSARELPAKGMGFSLDLVEYYPNRIYDIETIRNIWEVLVDSSRKWHRISEQEMNETLREKIQREEP